VLIGFTQQGNLGLGYLAASLRAHGHEVDVVDCEQPAASVAGAVRRRDPVLVGFSVIFQPYLDRFAALARRLRADGVAAHLTAGGHFPSLDPQTTFELLPELDSIVRFEGELTLNELVDALNASRDWRTVPGIAYRRGTQTVETPARPLLADLDQLPYPHETVAPRAILGRTAVQLTASRGCARSCSFCSVQTFYRGAGGPIVRTRRPAAVASEMRTLHEHLGATIFLFQDDDFPMWGRAGRRWVAEFLDELARQGLAGRVAWKVACRADQLDGRLLERMRRAGLFLVYLGLEAGTAEGLRALHKETTVEQNEGAVELLKGHGILYDFGFMMLEPSSSFETMRGNLAFLRRIAGDGSAAAEFCRMVPYEGTPVERELERSGRLRGGPCDPGYEYLDARLDAVSQDIHQALCATGWILSPQSLAQHLKFARTELAVADRLVPGLKGVAGYRERLRTITRSANTVVLDVMESIAEARRRREAPLLDHAALREQAAAWTQVLVSERDAFVERNQAAILAGLPDETA
jgi:Fe-S oxidoreductase